MAKIDSDSMRIRLEIAEKPFSLTIKRSEEEIVRRAAKRIKEEIGELRRKHDATLMEYLSMAALLIAIENEHGKERIKLSRELRDIEELAGDVEAFLGGGV